MTAKGICMFLITYWYIECELISKNKTVGNVFPTVLTIDKKWKRSGTFPTENPVWQIEQNLVQYILYYCINQYNNNIEIGRKMPNNNSKNWDSLISRTKIYLIIIALLIVCICILNYMLILPGIIVYGLIIWYTMWTNKKEKQNYQNN